MAYNSFVIVIDTPSIKRYVFGTDPLNEMRGASAHLDWLNRVKMEELLCQHLSKADIKPIYANGGSAQFLVHECDKTTVDMACTNIVRYIRNQTGGEVRVVYGMAPLKDDASYREAVRKAHFQLRCQRDFATCYRSASLIPTMMECQSASHLPAQIVNRGTEGRGMLSKASYQKEQQGREARRHGLWTGWMKHLNAIGSWPGKDQWNKLRCKSLTDIGDHSSWPNYIGVVYADGNAMGQIVQTLDHPETFRQFSKIVDDSIRQACFTALSQIFQAEIERIREAFEQDHRFKSFPADILLLGGDDLLVAVPADHALNFALKVTEEFESLTQKKIAALEDAESRQFFRDHLGDHGFTISCGVAIAKSNYPFYLSLDLAEQLLKNAKRKDSYGTQLETYGEARIDFHVVAGANSHALKEVREDTYQISSDARRTLRPLSCSQLELLHNSVQELRNVKFPHSKLHELREAALAKMENQADWRVRDIFVRCRHSSERRALWQAVHNLCPQGYRFDFPWFIKNDQRLLCVADIVEIYNLFRE